MAVFSGAPQVGVNRSKFPVKHTHKTSFNVGQLVPINVQEVLPGDTFSIDLTGIARVTSGFVKVPMDNLFMDIYAFFVPNRIVWKHWKEMMGENNSGPWVQQTEYQTPQVVLGGSALLHNTILSHMTGVVAEDSENNPLPEISINALPLRGYIKIWNEFFRDENLQAPVLETDDETLIYSDGVPTLNYMDASDGTTLLPANKFHDYFTSALPNTQKGNAVTISLAGSAPVVFPDKTLGVNNVIIAGSSSDGTTLLPANKFHDYFTSALPNTQKGNAVTISLAGTAPVVFPDKTLGVNNVIIAGSSSGGSAVEVTTDLRTDSNNNNAFFTGRGDIVGSAYLKGLKIKEGAGVTADLSNISLVTINELRTAFQLQRFLEKDARGGTRYIELIKAHFGVTNPDYRLQRPEFLGHLRQMINVDQVLQTSATGATGTAQGNVAGYSLTPFKGNLFTKSFTEHGFVITLACVRYNHTYQQGFNKLWFKKSRYDYYWPVFDNLGEQPIYQKEIYAFDGDDNDSVFGYQEAWAEYRYEPDMVSGQLNSGAAQSLDMWHFGDKYIAGPSLSPSWIKEEPANINRTINVSQNVADAFICDFLFTGSKVRAMSTHSIPGLIDHN